MTDSLYNGGVLHEQGKLTEMIAHFREMLALARQSPVRDPPTSENRLSEAADILYRHNAYAEAEPFYREVLQSRLRRLSADDDRVLSPQPPISRVCSPNGRGQIIPQFPRAAPSAPNWPPAPAKPSAS